MSSPLLSQRGRDYRALFNIRSRIANPVPNLEQLRVLPNVLDMIIGFVFEGYDGLADFKTLLLTTKWLKKIALKDSVIQKLNVTIHRDYGFWYHKSSHFNPLFLRLLRSRHAEAVYMEALRLVFKRSEVEPAIILIDTIMEKHRRAKIMFFVLNRFIRNSYLIMSKHFSLLCESLIILPSLRTHESIERRYFDFWEKEEEFCNTFSRDGMDMWRLGGIIERNVGCVHPKDVNTFVPTFTDTGNYPDCDYEHPRDEWEFMRDADRCPFCVLHWLARDLVKRSWEGEFMGSGGVELVL